MKKFLFKTSLMTLILSLAAGMSVSAVKHEAAIVENKLTVTITELQEGEQATVLVADDSVTLATVAENTDKVYYIDQAGAGTDKKVVFSDIDVTGKGDIMVWSGYTTMTGDAWEWSSVEEEGGGQDPNPGTLILGDVTGEGEVDGQDAADIVAYFLRQRPFDNTETGLDAADVTGEGDIDGQDAADVVAYFLRQRPFDRVITQ